MKLFCTNSFCAPPATKDGEVYLSWNMDIFGATKILRYLPVIYVASFPESYKYVCFGIPILFGLGVLNEKGVSFVPTAVGIKDGGGDGLLDFEFNNLCMETCDNVSDIIKTYKTKPRYSFPGLGAGIFLNYNCIWGDVEGNGVAIEHSSNHITFKYAEDGILAIANHHQFLDRNLTGSTDPNQQPAISGSYCRLGRMWNLLKQKNGNIDLQVLKEILSDHKLEIEHLKNYNYEEPIDDATICGHYWNIKNYIKERKFKKAYEAYIMGKTIMCWIIQPKKFTIWLCRGNPCNKPFLPMCFKQIFFNSSFKNLGLSIIINTKLNKFFFKLPIVKKFMDFIFTVFVKRLIILFFSILEKLVPIEVKNK
jgi:hypothetical protein